MKWVTRARTGGDRVADLGLTRPRRNHAVSLARLGVAGVIVLALGVASAQDPVPAPVGGAGVKTNEIDGATLFATVCGWCHEGGGRTAGRGPKLAGTQETDAYLISRIKNGKEGAMPAYGRAFTADQIRAIVAYIRTLTNAPSP